jgi:hypothetical protein
MACVGALAGARGPMPRYHFHIMHGGPVLLDTAGTDLPDLEAARDHALRMARGPLGGAVTMIDQAPGWQVEVMDEARNLVLLVPFPFRPAGRAQ